MSNETIHDILNAQETETLRQIWNAGGSVQLTGWKNRDLDWYPLHKNGLALNVLIRSGREPIYEIRLTAMGRELSRRLFEPVAVCPHCGQPII